MTVPAQPGLEATIGSLNPADNGAQSPAPSPVAFAHGANGERTFIADDIAKARKEEKEKLYPQIESLKSEWAKAQETLKAIQEQREQELAEVARKQAEKDEALRLKKEEEMSAKALLDQKLRETNETWEQRFSQLQQERELERAQIAKERAYNELVDYRNAQLANAGAEVAPQFHNFINGETKEQIDNAIAQAKIATQSIADEVAAVQAAQRSQMRGVSPTGYTALGPMENVGQKQYSPEDISNMSMAEYSKFRQDYGLAGRESNRGILG